jgi:hypothetical protein
MARIRRDLHQDVQGVVASAEEAIDWRHHVRRYPWAALCLALAAGYLVVPKGKRVIKTVGQRAGEALIAPGEPVESVSKQDEKRKKAGLFASLVGFLVPVAVRAAQGYAAQYVESWIAQQGGFGPGAPQTPARGSQMKGAARTKPPGTG